MITLKLLFLKLIEPFKNRFVLFFLFAIIFLSINLYFENKPLPTPEIKNLWFYSGIFMVLFSILFIEPYYTSPKNVITNTIPLLLVLLSIKSSFAMPEIWWVGISILLLLLVTSLIALSLQDKNKSPDHIRNKAADIMKKSVVLLGQGKILYSSVFVYFLMSYYSINDSRTLLLFLIWLAIILINPKKIKGTFSAKRRKRTENSIGEIFSVQSKKIFMVKLFEDRRAIKKFDIVKFHYSMQDTDDLIITGIVFDTYLLNQEKWAKVLQLKVVREDAIRLDKNIVYKIIEIEELSNAESDLNINNFVGVVEKGSEIGKIIFEYSKKKDDLQEGDLLELSVEGKRLFYQVVNGKTDIEVLEEKNKTGFIFGEAIQLGEWEQKELSFVKFGWVPNINTPLFLANTADIKIDKYEYPMYRLGNIPNTTLPSVLNLKDAISHHLALLGVTGSGKTFLAREIINQLKKDTKIICVDFTGEYEVELKSLKPKKLMKNIEGLVEVEKLLAEKEDIRNRDKSKVLEIKKKIFDKITIYIEEFMKDKVNNLGIFEIPDLSNSTFILEFTQIFLDCVFKYAKNNECEDICIVIEEAHTVIPESSFIGEGGDFGYTKGLVNKMSQIALQGRKYGVGLIVIAQRTANVSKTVLTQCNTIICFQAFDETSFNFVGNYIGKELVKTLPNLKQYHAIVAGKAIKSNIPMIVNLER